MVWPAAATIAVCVVLSALLSADHARDVWHTGAFYDTDDAMRAVQLRGWLAGQSWYDLSVQRLDPPAGVFMHWSRIVDMPLAALVSLATPFFGAEMAERFARLIFPAMCLAALFASAGWTASVLGGRRAVLPAIILCFLGAPFLGQFVPGRIDHHAPQIVLLMLMTGGLMAAYEPRRARYAGLAALCAALSLSISLENLPLIALMVASLPLAFVTQGAHVRSALLWFAAAFAVAIVGLFVATVGPAHRFEAACDALSIAHVGAALVGCAVLAGLAAGTTYLASARARLIAVCASAPLPILALRVTGPQCLGDPFVALDPLVRDIWLHHVGEVEPLLSFLRTSEWTALAMVVPLVIALALAGVGARDGTGVSRGRYALLAALLAMTLAVAGWGIRALTSGLPLVAVVGAPWLLRATDRVGGGRLTRIAAATLAALPLSPLLLTILLPADAAPSSEGGTLACVRPAALAPLATLEPGTILAPIDMGSHLLAFTPHGVFAAPYHRDNAGNRLAIDALMATPDEARAIVEKAGATYIAVCATSGQAKVMTARAPHGLAAMLLAGQTPDWLEPVALASPQKVFRVRQPWGLRTTTGG